MHEECSRIAADASQKSESAGKKIISDNEQRISRGKDKLYVLANIELNKKLLAEKKSLVEESFETAFEKIKNLSVNQLKSFVKKLIVSAVETGGEDIVLSKGDIKKLGNKFVDEISGDVSRKIGRKVRLKVLAGDIPGGFIIRQGKKEKNYTLEMIFRRAKEDMETEVAKILFK
jgi:V/A-type H+-transporting ATPase subunit E